MTTTTRRVRKLATLELVNIPVWAVALFGLLGFPATFANLVGFAVFAVLLAQGAAYWVLKLRQLRMRLPALPGIRVFRVLRLGNVVLLAVALAITGQAVVTTPGRGSWLGFGLAVFGVFEHLNYFHVQLMHDTVADLRRLRSTGFRRSHLARDLVLSI